MKNELDKFIHDVRNPLNSISVNAELARLLLQKGNNSEEAAAALDTILQECKKCGAILDKPETYFKNQC